MIRANELMIGDWVKFSDSSDWTEGLQGVPVQVKGLRDDDGAIKVYDPRPDKGYSDIWSDNEEDFEPIPLTPEILEKNGFYYDEDRKAYLMGVIFQVKPERYGLFSLKICGCPYPLNTVSQLQHALRLCEIEKEITI